MVIETDEERRSRYIDALVAVGFTKIIESPSIDQALQLLEIEAIDWIVLYFEPNLSLNGLHLLNLIITQPAISDINVSFFLKKDAAQYLQLSYTYGLLSHFFITDDFEIEQNGIKYFDRVLRQNQSESCRIAADYYRQILMEGKKFDELLDFEKQLLTYYPGDVKILIHLAKAQIKLDRFDEAEQTLDQAEMIDGTIAAEVRKIKSKHLKIRKMHQGTVSGKVNINALGIKSCVVIDSDPAVQNLIRWILSIVGVSKVFCFEKSAEALKWLEQNEEPSIILHEWKLTGVSGPILIQRIREMGLNNTVLMVISSLVSPEDKPLIREMGVDSVISKPIDKKGLLEALIVNSQQGRLPTKDAYYEKKISRLLRANKIEDATNAIAKYYKNCKVDVQTKQYIEAQLCYYQKDFETAKIKALSSIKMGNQSIGVFHLVGKVLMQLREFKTALLCFEKAQKMSPMNIYRLCKIAEGNWELGRKDKALEALDQVKEMDEDSILLSAAEVKYHMTHGDVKKAQKLISDMDKIDDILAYLNNRGVALIKCRQFEEGIEFYKRALEALPKDRKDVRCAVYYNYGLALVKNDEYKEAQKVLKKASQGGNKSIVNKAKSLKSRLERAIKRGELLILTGDDERVLSAKNKPVVFEDVSILNIMKISPGDIACYLIAKETEEIREQAQVIFSNTPMYKSA